MTMTLVPPTTHSTADIVASNIRAEAARLGYTQVEFGRALGISQNQITRRWKGVINWQLDELDDVAALLGLTVTDLITPPRGGLGYEKLPRLDSNQQPADYTLMQIEGYLLAA